jgi:transposase
MRHIGVDLGKRAFTACFLDADHSSRLATFLMSPEGLARFRAELAPDDRIAVEVGTNAYYFHDQIHESVAEVVLVSTYHFAVIAKSKKKTDRGDAILLARFLKLDYLPQVVMPEGRIRAKPAASGSRAWKGSHRSIARCSIWGCANWRRWTGRSRSSNGPSSGWVSTCPG